MANTRSLHEFAARYAYTAARCLSVVLAGPFSARGRERVKNLGLTLGFEEGRPRLPKIGVEQIVGPGVSVTLCEPRQGEWEVTSFELAVLDALAAKFQPRRLFEIGTFDGRTALNLAANAAPDAVVYTLDLPPGTVELPNGVVAGGKFRDSPLRDRIVQLYGDSFAFDFAPYAGTIDFVFVDAGHTREAVANDSRKALDLLAGGRGVVVWHDYAAWAGVTEAVDELVPMVKNAKHFAQIRGTSLACLVTT